MLIRSSCKPVGERTLLRAQGSSFFLSSCDQGPVRTPPLTDTWTCGIKVSSAWARNWRCRDYISDVGLPFKGLCLDPGKLAPMCPTMFM